MNRFVFIICFFCFWVSVDAQNLIYNGSFEEYYSCPVSNDLGNGQLELAKGWWKPTLGTSDYFNACNNGVVSVPSNFWGFQPAQEGQGYIGLVPIEYYSGSNLLGLEYVQTKLIEKLVPCNEYTFSMFVSLANKSKYAFGDLSVMFSANQTNENTTSTISLIPQFTNESLPIIDTMEWVQISFNYIATGFEQYLTIGYKDSDFNGDTVLIQDINPGYVYSYYYFDNVSLTSLGEVSVEECNLGEISLPNVFSPNNDGINDVLDIQSYSHLEPIVKIVNRWGNIVAILDQNNLIWTGTNESEGVYFYLMEYTIGSNQYTQNGFIQLLR
jgi:gliding motility-associated-like protein